MRSITERERQVRTRRRVMDENPVTLDDMNLTRYGDQLDKLKKIEFRKDGGAHPFGDGVCRHPGMKGLK